MKRSSNIIFLDDSRLTLRPLTYTRCASQLRIGILTIVEKWQRRLGISSCHHLTEGYLSDKYQYKATDDNLIIVSTLLPTPRLVDSILSLRIGEALHAQNKIICARLTKDQAETYKAEGCLDPSIKKLNCNHPVKTISYPEQLFLWNHEELQSDFELITAGRTSQDIDGCNRTKGDHQIFVEEGATIEHSILNATDGPIYIGKNAVILDGCALRNGVSLGDHAVLKMGAKIYGATTIGPYSKIGGEVKNVVVQGYSNKSHEGYLGNSVLGEWCNLGADTNSSNLKNDYSQVKLFDYESNKMRATGTQFCGLIMGDHSKTGINTMFNTGTITGICCNIYGSGYQKNFIPSFSWGGSRDYLTYRVDKVIQVVNRVLERKQLRLSPEDENILRYLSEQTAQYRR